jgi:hypothetical protein
MDAGQIALWIIGIVGVLFAIGCLLSFVASFYYFDHK